MQDESTDDVRYFDWLAGLIDGEGSFQIKSHRSKGRDYCYPSFSIGLRDDDEPMLRQALERVGIGRIEYVAGRQGGAYYSHRQVRWIVKRKADCLVLMRLLTVHPLRSKKSRDFDVWAAAVEEVNGPNRIDHMKRLARYLSAGRLHPSDPRYSPMPVEVSSADGGTIR